MRVLSESGCDLCAEVGFTCAQCLYDENEHLHALILAMGDRILGLVEIVGRTAERRGLPRLPKLTDAELLALCERCRPPAEWYESDEEDLI